MALNLLDLLIDPNLGTLIPRKNVQVLDSVSTSLPTNASSITIDSIIVSQTMRILYTNLSNPAQNNRVYKVVETGLLLNLVLETDGHNADGAPYEGEVLYVELGNNYAGSIWGTNSLIWFRIDHSNLASSTLSSSGMQANLNMNTFQINNVEDPASPQDAATKHYIDNKVIAITEGGTGQITASTAINALLPTQTGNNGLFLTTNGTAASWAAAGGGGGANTTLSNLGTTSINAGLLPASNDTLNLGSSSLSWNVLYAATAADSAGTSVDFHFRTLKDDAGNPMLNWLNVGSGLEVSANITSTAANTYTVGNNGTPFKGMYTYSDLWYGSSSGILTHKPNASTTSYTLTWPATQASGTQVLQNNGSGALSWGTGASYTPPTSQVSLNTDNGSASNSNSRQFLNVGVNNGGADITYTNDAAKGANFVINTTGIYAISYTDAASSSYFGIAINGDTTTTVETQTTGVIVAAANCTCVSESCSWTGHITSGSVVNPIIDTDNGSAVNYNTFTITRLS